MPKLLNKPSLDKYIPMLIIVCNKYMQNTWYQQVFSLVLPSIDEYKNYRILSMIEIPLQKQREYLARCSELHGMCAGYSRSSFDFNKLYKSHCKIQNLKELENFKEILYIFNLYQFTNIIFEYSECYFRSLPLSCKNALLE